MSLRRRNKPIAEFSSASIADIVFLLLIYFMLTSTFVAQVGLKVDLPKSSSDKPSPAKHSVTVTADGQYAWDQELVEKDEIPRLIREAIAGDVADKTITLRTDKLVTMEEAAFVISAVAEQGGTIVILTKKGSN